ncbi:MAG: LysR family transcriptional regulator [Phycisphaerales bacterium]|nr:LysR family transcriptional regulator [Hyphomonadaceae bacterium]
MPTLRQLQFLTAVRAEGSFVAAAEAVGVTQPTLSAGIKDLETALGVVLVERGRLGAVLTPAGEDAVERAARALSEVEELVRAAQGAGEPLAGAFKLGAIPTIAPFLLPKALPLLRKRFPKLRLLMREDLTGRLIEQLRMRTLDAAVIALPYEAAGIASMPIADDEFLVLTPDDHPLAKRNDLAPEHLQSEELLLLEDGHCLRDQALSACKLTPSRRSAEVGATSLHTLVQMVAGGMGVTLLPKIAAEGGAAAGAHVAIRQFAQPVFGRSIGIAWREGGPREEEARLLAGVLRELF